MADSNEVLIAPIDGQRIEVLPRPTRARHQRELMSEHVLYELQALSAMFALTSLWARTEANPIARHTKEWWRSEAIVSSLLLHVRTVDEFIYGDWIGFEKGQRQPINLGGAASALDFVAEAQAWLDERPPRPEALRRRRINRTIVHLTWDRTEAGWEDPALSDRHQAHQKEQDWPLPELWDGLRPSLLTFLEHVDHGAVCDQFGAYAQEALEMKAVVDLAP